MADIKRTPRPEPPKPEVPGLADYKTEFYAWYNCPHCHTIFSEPHEFAGNETLFKLMRDQLIDIVPSSIAHHCGNLGYRYAVTWGGECERPEVHDVVKETNPLLETFGTPLLKAINRQLQKLVEWMAERNE